MGYGEKLVLRSMRAISLLCINYALILADSEIDARSAIDIEINVAPNTAWHIRLPRLEKSWPPQELSVLDHVQNIPSLHLGKI
jgi:hypothetical protein